MTTNTEKPELAPEIVASNRGVSREELQERYPGYEIPAHVPTEAEQQGRVEKLAVTERAREVERTLRGTREEVTLAEARTMSDFQQRFALGELTPKELAETTPVKVAKVAEKYQIPKRSELRIDDKIVAKSEMKVISGLKGKAQFNRMVDAGLIARGAKYVAPASGAKQWQYIPVDEVIAQIPIQAKAATRAKAQARADIQRQIKALAQKDVKALAASVKENIGIDIDTTNLKQTTADIKKTLGAIVKDVGIMQIPFYGRHYEHGIAQRPTSPGGKRVTAGEWGLNAFGLVTDLLIVAFGIGALAAGARGAVGTSRAARIAGAVKGGGQFLLAEVKAPYTMIRHPIQTAKGVLAPIETVVRWGKTPKIPLSAAETSYSTVRLAANVFDNADDAMSARDVATMAAMRTGDFVTDVNGVKIKLSPTAIQSVGSPVAIHSTPDVRPFLGGAQITAGREGGLFLAPNLHTRFTGVSAFGDLPKGNIPGAVIIRDAQLLDALQPSGKIYRGTAEIEAMLKAGTNLPPPSQILVTRDTSNKLMQLVIIGEPFSKAEIARLKLVGSLDNIKQIFTPGAQISGKANVFDSIIDLRSQSNALVNKAMGFRASGDIMEARKLEAEAARLGDRINTMATTSRTPLGGRIVGGFANTGRAPIEALASSPRTERISKIEARAPSIRIRPTLPARVEPTRIAPSRLDVPRVDEPRVPPPGEPRVPRVDEPRVPPPGEPRVPRVDEPRVPPPGIIFPPRISGGNKKKRKQIANSKGAIAWRMGELQGKSVWHGAVYPYSQPDGFTVVGNKPRNTTEVKGPRSAYQTIKLLYGDAPDRRVTGDVGFMDFFIDPLGGKRVGIGFKPDPKGETKGDITIGQRRTPPITERRPVLQGRSRIARITPKQPRLRR